MREFARKHNFAPASRPPVLSPSEQAASRRHARQPLVAAGEAVTALPPGFAQRPPSVAVFSLAAGVGKTCLTATLGRALSALGEQVLLVDTAPAGSLPPYFGASKGRPGVVRTFSPNPFSPSGLVGLENRKNMQLLNLEAERFPLLESGQDWMLGKLVHEGRGLSRLLIDIATAGPELRRLLLLRPVILVPMLPELEAIAGLDSIESLLSQPAPDGGEAQVFFVLNQFDVASAQHQQVRDMLQAQLGDRLLPWVIHRSAAVSEALAESMTVMDYAPDSPAAEDYRELAAWLHQH